MRLLSLFLLILVTYAPFAHAETPSFRLPLECTYGQNCWVMNYADTGPNADGKAIDPACLSRTYEGHKGTDFDITDERTMKKGVAVVAAKDGKVTRARDGEPDQWSNAADLVKIREASKDCGNAVLIDHGDGWQTMYCHMKKGSLSVKAGQKVNAGQKIGEVGLSGYTQFPHLHFGITHNGKIIDPFTGSSIEETCGKTPAPLWDESVKISYEPIAITKTGFESTTPALRELDLGFESKKEFFSKQTGSFVYFAVFYGSRKDDVVELAIFDPDGKEFAKDTQRLTHTRARQMLYVGRKTDQVLLRKGEYRGIVTIKRGEQRWTKEDMIAVR